MNFWYFARQKNWQTDRHTRHTHEHTDGQDWKQYPASLVRGGNNNNLHEKLRRRLCLRLLWPWPLTFWPNSMTQTQVHVWPNCGEISSNIYEDIVFIHYSMVITSCNLDLWSRKLISTSTNPKYRVTKIGRNSLHWFVRYGVYKVFWSLNAVTLTFDLLTLSVCPRPSHIRDLIMAKLAKIIYRYIVFIQYIMVVVTLFLDLWTQKLMSTSTNSNTYVTKTGRNSLHSFVRYGVHYVFGSLPAVTLTFDLLAPKSHHHIYEYKYICNKN